MSYDAQRAGMLRDRLELERATLDSLRTLAKRDDLQMQLSMVSRWLDDVETRFLQRTEMIDGSREYEATWFDDTELLITRATEERMTIQAVIEKGVEPAASASA
jgi:hypothetical protein